MTSEGGRIRWEEDDNGARDKARRRYSVKLRSYRAYPYIRQWQGGGRGMILDFPSHPVQYSSCDSFRPDLRHFLVMVCPLLVYYVVVILLLYARTQ